MAETYNELHKQIAEKNFILNSLRHAPNHDNKEMEKIKNELDKLLYTYYKSLKCNCNNTMVLWEGTG